MGLGVTAYLGGFGCSTFFHTGLAKPRQRMAGMAWHGMAWFGMVCLWVNTHVVIFEAIFSNLAYNVASKFVYACLLATKM